MGGRRRERVNGGRGGYSCPDWTEEAAKCFLSFSSTVLVDLLSVLQHFLSSCSFFFLALTLVALCMSSYLCCTFLQMACNSCFLLSISPSVHWASLSVFAHPHFSSCISVFLSCTLLYSPWILQVFFLFLDFNVFVLNFFVKYLQICIFLLKILENILHLFAFLPVVPSMSVLRCSASLIITCNSFSFFSFLELALDFLVLLHFCSSSLCCISSITAWSCWFFSPKLMRSSLRFQVLNFSFYQKLSFLCFVLAQTSY